MMSWKEIADDLLQEYKDLWKKMANSMSCGYCGERMDRREEGTCEKCGRMLCVECSSRWGWCKDHIPVCYHPELFVYNQEKPDGVQMIGSCKHNMTCPLCGFGWGQAPDPCDDLEEEFALFEQASNEDLLLFENELGRQG